MLYIELVTGRLHATEACEIDKVRYDALNESSNEALEPLIELLQNKFNKHSRNSKKRTLEMLEGDPAADRLLDLVSKLATLPRFEGDKAHDPCRIGPVKIVTLDDLAESLADAAGCEKTFARETLAIINATRGQWRSESVEDGRALKQYESLDAIKTDLSSRLNTLLDCSNTPLADHRSWGLFDSPITLSMSSKLTPCASMPPKP